MKILNDILQAKSELQHEYDLCNKYFMEEDIFRNKTEHEKLALEIVTSCMQTLGCLINCIESIDKCQ